MYKEYEVKWKSHGTVMVLAESQEDADYLFDNAPLEYLDVDDLCDNCYSYEEK